MTTQETEQLRDSMWTEIRQLVLDDGPVVVAIDAALAQREDVPTEDREALIATLIAERCAAIASLAPGPFNGMPVTIVLGSWAGAHAVCDGILS